MKRPNLFILGAPKCGTTALATWLASHPDVFVSPVKEPHYFSEEHRLTPTLDRYEALFADADPQRHRWVCEASVWHLFSDTAVPNILQYAPDARFIVMVRNPLEMAPSMHEQHRFNGNELVADFAEALALDEARGRGEWAGVRPGYTQPQQLGYLRSCALGWQLERLYGRVPRERIHVVVHDDMAADPQGSYLNVLHFLGLEQVLPQNFGKVNAAKRRKSFLLDTMTLRLAELKGRLGIERRLGFLAWVRRRNVRYRERKPLALPMRESLASEFSADVLILARLLGRDLQHWLQLNGD
jgi:hypothetical protein